MKANKVNEEMWLRWFNHKPEVKKETMAPVADGMQPMSIVYTLQLKNGNNIRSHILL